MTDPNTPPVHDQGEPAWFRAYREQQEQAMRELREENAELRGRIQGQADVRGPSYNENLPQSAREWGLPRHLATRQRQLLQIVEGLSEEAELSPQAQQVLEAAQQELQNLDGYYNVWDQQIRPSREEEERARERALEELIRKERLEAEDPEAGIIRAALTGGATRDQVEELILSRRRRIMELEGDHAAQDRTTEALVAGGAIETERASQPPPEGGEKTPEQKINEELAAMSARRTSSHEAVLDERWSDPSKLFS